jgi:hypothetical protein
VEIVCLEKLSIAFERVAIARSIVTARSASDRVLFPKRRCSRAIEAIFQWFLQHVSLLVKHLPIVRGNDCIVYILRPPLFNA